MKKKKSKSLRNLVKASRRLKMKSDGCYDGRFNQRVESSGKLYTRKNKHKGKDYD